MWRFCKLCTRWCNLFHLCCFSACATILTSCRLSSLTCVCFCPNSTPNCTVMKKKCMKNIKKKITKVVSLKSNVLCVRPSNINCIVFFVSVPRCRVSCRAMVSNWKTAMENLWPTRLGPAVIAKTDRTGRRRSRDGVVVFADVTDGRWGTAEVACGLEGGVEVGEELLGAGGSGDWLEGYVGHDLRHVNYAEVELSCWRWIMKDESWKVDIDWEKCGGKK